MSVSVLQDKPAYVAFEVRPEEDRAASMLNGRYTARDVDFVIVTPAGSKDRIERNATEWFASMEMQVRQNRMPAEWLRVYRNAYEAWKKGCEIPLEGTAIRNWPLLSPSQAKSIIDARIRTVEELAVANEESLTRIGMGARGLKSKAIEWVQSGSKEGAGAQVEELVALRAQCEALKASVHSQQTMISNLQTQLALYTAMTGPGPAAVASDDDDFKTF